MRLIDLRHRLRALGAAPLHEERVLRQWVQAKPQDAGRRRLENFLPKPLREALPGLMVELDGLATLRSRHEAAEEGSARLLVDLADGQAIESVLLPRGGLCVSTQVGCAVGCVFCMTGTTGLLRQVGSAEIVAQVVLARRLCKADAVSATAASADEAAASVGAANDASTANRSAPRSVSKVVFMGMGEPAHNLENVIEAIQLLGTLGNIGHKNLVFSTVGDERVFERLPQERVKPALALSLHTTKAALREQLLPRAPRLTPEELVHHAQAYAKATAYPVQYQWTLMEGVNDGDDEIDGIVRLLAGQYAVMNLIPYNAVPQMPWRRPSWERAAAMARALHRRGVLTKLRHSAGQDVEGGCGQLRARAGGGGSPAGPVGALPQPEIKAQPIRFRPNASP
jgi:23S rRNA (adenine2503-C2)-methyltransferase